MNNQGYGSEANQHLTMAVTPCSSLINSAVMYAKSLEKDMELPDPQVRDFCRNWLSPTKPSYPGHPSFTISIILFFSLLLEYPK
jgi:hypothetical protein